mmetsp:Transcript_42177/g.83424  ORF Transcript_42177/g.83424 Transcript_42177/m.83424 type:complete len:419 (-) Transcript_42177:1320-2576(-)
MGVGGGSSALQADSGATTAVAAAAACSTMGVFGGCTALEADSGATTAVAVAAAAAAAACSTIGVGGGSSAMEGGSGTTSIAVAAPVVKPFNQGRRALVCSLRGSLAATAVAATIAASAAEPCSGNLLFNFSGTSGSLGSCSSCSSSFLVSSESSSVSNSFSCSTSSCSSRLSCSSCSSNASRSFSSVCLSLCSHSFSSCPSCPSCSFCLCCSLSSCSFCSCSCSSCSSCSHSLFKLKAQIVQHEMLTQAFAIITNRALQANILAAQTANPLERCQLSIGILLQFSVLRLHAIRQLQWVLGKRLCCEIQQLLPRNINVPLKTVCNLPLVFGRCFIGVHATAQAPVCRNDVFPACATLQLKECTCILDTHRICALLQLRAERVQSFAEKPSVWNAELLRTLRGEILAHVIERTCQGDIVS